MSTQPDSRPISAWTDHAVSRIMEGPLSRGVVNKERRQAFLNLLDPTRPEFTEGMLDTLNVLYRHRFTTAPTLTELIAITGIKRASIEDRERWLRGLQHLPEQTTDYDDPGVVEFERGRLAGALTLSGMEGEYDLSRPQTAG